MDFLLACPPALAVARAATRVAAPQADPAGIAVLLLIFGGLVAVSVVFSRAVDRLGVPVLLLFIGLGMLGGSEGIGGIAFDDQRLAVQLGTTALVLILFDGGLNTAAASIGAVLLPAGALATVGVALTAALVAGFARLLGLGWTEAMLLGAVVSSTDAAAVFSVLRGGGVRLTPRVGRLIELESCINDPMAVILTTALIGAVSTGRPPGWGLLLIVPAQLLIGTLVGLATGWAARGLLRTVRVGTVGLYPALTLSVAFLAFGGATLLGGSGFLAVYVAAVVVGNSAIPYRSGLTRIHDALSWMAQIGMFLMLGLLVYPSQLLPVAWLGLGLGLFLAFVARPVAAAVCMAPFRYPPRQVAYVGWIGLRGAVPIILGTFPVLAGVPGAGRLFHLVFFIVVVSSVVPGATVRFVTRRMGMGAPERPAPAAVLEVNSSELLSGELASFLIEPSLAVCGARLSELEFPAASSVVLLVRGRDLIAARGGTRLTAGDHVYLVVHDGDRAFIELLFGAPEAA